MYWLIGDTIATKQGSAKVTAITIVNKEATLQFPDGTTIQYPYVQQEKIKVSTRPPRYHSSTPKPPKVKKPPLTPEEKEMRKHERILAKAQAKLAKLAALKG
jgi:hypothetical protein